ncbi:Glycosyltransferase AglD [uncultured archaeon]|nr:Glycosyltransferase AglD [uncultured archaeon]
MKVSIVIPAYNEERRIGNTLKEYGAYFKEVKKKKHLDFEILVVINNTKDKTEEIVKSYSKKYKEIRYLNFKEGGKGFAIRQGFLDALKRDNDLIGFVDADMATPPEAFYDLVKNIGKLDGIIASRWISGSTIKTKQSILRKVYSMGFNFIVRSLFLMNYRDTQCGAKLFKREVISSIVNDINLTQWAFDVNLLYLCKKRKFKVKECPTIWEDKAESKLSVTRIPIQMFLGVVRLRLINSFFEPILRPVKFILRLGDWLINQ